MANIVLGQWGGNGGGGWDDGDHHTGIRYISIYSGHCIDSICVWYDNNGTVVGAGKHGGDGGGQHEINLQYPDEYLIGMSGHYAPFHFVRTPVVRSLTFRSNRRTFGPYGREEGTAFNVPIQRGRIVSFTGRSGLFLDAIGVRISPN